ncbi:MAG: hypothetical protein BWZ02_03260 [Lentisphaerae bacterium ADurb.BinA184]|nr:MAG: hypothetical protein BWZ02_03260 [Lentisphaerae bacterium ADurb.BinA184]
MGLDDSIGATRVPWNTVGQELGHGHGHGQGNAEWVMRPTDRPALGGPREGPPVENLWGGRAPGLEGRSPPACRDVRGADRCPPGHTRSPGLPRRNPDDTEIVPPARQTTGRVGADGGPGSVPAAHARVLQAALQTRPTSSGGVGWLHATRPSHLGTTRFFGGGGTRRERGNRSPARTSPGVPPPPCPAGHACYRSGRLGRLAAAVLGLPVVQSEHAAGHAPVPVSPGGCPRAPRGRSPESTGDLRECQTQAKPRCRTSSSVRSTTAVSSAASRSFPPDSTPPCRTMPSSCFTGTARIAGSTCATPATSAGRRARPPSAVA